MGTADEFCKKYKIKSKNFGIKQKDVKHIIPEE
jgi:hypothetical protein